MYPIQSHECNFFDQSYWATLNEWKDAKETARCNQKRYKRDPVFVVDLLFHFSEVYFH